MEYFKKLLELSKMERAEDQRSYLEQTASLSAADRRAQGSTWYPVAIRDTELGRGDYLTVELERTTHKDIVHKLRFGASARLFSNHDPQTDFVDGVITYAGSDRLKISLRTDELPEWSSNGKLGVDLLFDDNSYDEMQRALDIATKQAEEREEGKLIRVLTGREQPTFDERISVTPNARLNDRQQVAVNRIVQANELSIVHGPPGTGKTTTIVQAIREMLARDEKQILVVAPSNTAVDLLSEKLSAEGVNVLRVGNPARVSEQLMSLTLDSKMSGHASMKEIKRLKKQAAEYKNIAHKYKRNFGKSERDQRKALFDEAHKIMKEVDKLEKYIIDDLLTRAQVIAATPVGASHYTVRDMRYHTVVIDEAGQAIEPICWIPLLKAKKVILAGDHCQLPPTIKSTEAAKQGLATTLLEKCIALYPQAVVLLEEQYRMHELIMGYSSQVFYDSQLKAHSSVAGHLVLDTDTPLAFVDTAGCGYDEKNESTSISNPEEAALLFRHLTQYVAELSGQYTADNFPTIAIISPYRQQIAELKEQLAHNPELLRYGNKITVNTIDSFQGQERDIVYISMTRSNDAGTIGFLSDIRRMNVAMTRARKKLVIVGDSATLSRSPFYAGFITYAEKADAYKSAWEFMDV